MSVHVVESDRLTHSRFHEIQYEKFQKLIIGGILDKEVLEKAIEEFATSGRFVEERLMADQVPKEEILECLAGHYRVPFMIYEAGLLVSPGILHEVDLEKLKKALWFPLAVDDRTAHVIAYRPWDPAIIQEVREAFKVETVNFLVALPSDIVRIIEDHQDVNPSFPPAAGRTPLARLRTWLADQRTILAQYRTSLAKGRTGLAFIRTGISFISIALVLLRMFGIGYLTLLEVMLLGMGLVMTVDGIIWYLPARAVGSKPVDYVPTESTFGTTVLELYTHEGERRFRRTPPIEGAQELRTRWNRLTPVMKRRFLAIDRTDLAEERTILVDYRTIMARARTGLAFTRTGVAFIGLGIALLRQFPAGAWTFFDGLLILVGIAMTLEGFHWYAQGRQAGQDSLQAVQKISKKPSIWDFMFRPFDDHVNPEDLPPMLSIKGTHAPGIWGTTGLALERTLIAERRNVKSRLRTIMARARTGMAFIRTGTSILSVGMGLMVYFGTVNLYWTVFNVTLVLIGLVLVTDGFYWYIPAERTKKQFPYCFADMEIAFPDYAKPALLWKKVVFSHEDL